MWYELLDKLKKDVADSQMRLQLCLIDACITVHEHASKHEMCLCVDGLTIDTTVLDLRGQGSSHTQHSLCEP